MGDPNGDKEKIGGDMAEDQTAVAAFRKSHPIDFRLYDDDDQPALYIDPVGRNHHLEITNTSQQVIQLKVPGDETASAQDHHFELRFRPGTISKTYEQIVLDGNDWKMSPEKPNAEATVSLYFLSTQEDLTIEPGEKVALTLRNVSADAGGGARGTRVELRYQNLTYAGETTPLQGHREQHLSIVNHQGRKHIPLHVGFVGSHTILNDGSSPNELTLRITNVLKLDPAYPERSSISLRGVDEYGDAASKFILSFDVSDTEEWALGTTSDVKNATVVHLRELGTVSGFASAAMARMPAEGLASKRRPSSRESVISSLDLKNELTEEIPQNTRIRIIREDDTPKELTVSQKADMGDKKIYVKTLGAVAPKKDSKVYRVVPWQIDRPSEGESPEWILTLQTTRALKAGEHIQFKLSNIISSLPSGHANLYLHYENIPGYWDGQFVCPVRKAPMVYRGDKVGIGTAQPGSVLHIKSPEPNNGLTIQTGNNKNDQGIAFQNAGGWYTWHIHRKDAGKGKADLVFGSGLDAELEELEERVRFTHDGKVGIRTPEPKIHLAIGDSVTGLEPQGDGELAIFTNNRERVRFDNSGHVGIGTTSPIAQLSLGGRNEGSAGPPNGPQLLLAGSNNQGANIATDEGPAYKLRITNYDNDGSELYPIHVSDEQGKTDFWLKAAIQDEGEPPKMYVRGNVGIGTTDLGEWKLKVEGGPTYLGGGLEVRASSPIGDQRQSFATTDAQNSTFRIAHPEDKVVAIGGNKDHHLRLGGFEYDLSSFTPRLSIDTDGNVGIGTTTPGAELEVSGTLKADKIRIGNTEISEKELNVLRRLANSQLTVLIRSATGYTLDNYKYAHDKGDHNRTIQFRSIPNADKATKMTLIIV